MVGVPHPRWVEAVVAVIVVKAGNRFRRKRFMHIARSISLDSRCRRTSCSLIYRQRIRERQIAQARTTAGPRGAVCLAGPVQRSARRASPRCGLYLNDASWVAEASDGRRRQDGRRPGVRHPGGHRRDAGGLRSGDHCHRDVGRHAPRHRDRADGCRDDASRASPRGRQSFAAPYPLKPMMYQPGPFQPSSNQP